HVRHRLLRNLLLLEPQAVIPQVVGLDSSHPQVPQAWHEVLLDTTSSQLLALLISSRSHVRLKPLLRGTAHEPGRRDARLFLPSELLELPLGLLVVGTQVPAHALLVDVPLV